MELPAMFTAVEAPKGASSNLVCGGLSFFRGGVVIIEGSSLTHARILAAQRELGRVSDFAHGHFISSERRALSRETPAPNPPTNYCSTCNHPLTSGAQRTSVGIDTIDTR